MEALEDENAKLRRDLISAMDEANTAKEKAKTLVDDLKAEKQLIMEKDGQLQATKQGVKTVAAKVVEAFQQTEEYNTVLFIWNYKCFQLLRRYLIKHLSGVDLGGLDLKEVNNEMKVNEASQFVVATPEENALENTPTDVIGGDEATA